MEITNEEIILAALTLPNKPSPLDHLPWRLLKECINLLALFLTFLFNFSISSGTFPAVWKNPCVKPLLKKDCSDYSDVSGYRPISHLHLLSKLL